MATTSFAFGESYGVNDHYTFDDRDFENTHTSEQYSEEVLNAMCDYVAQ